MSSYDKLKKLGWLSAYSRQVLLTRHLIRLATLFASRNSMEVGRNDVLMLFYILRLSVHCPPQNQGRHAKLSVPYFPTDRPETFDLKLKAAPLQFHLMSTPTDELNWRLISGTDPLSEPFPRRHKPRGNLYKRSVKASTKEQEILNQFLFAEIENVGKGINLNRKKVADDRCQSLWKEGLFATHPEPEIVSMFFAKLERERESSFLEFFKNWFSGVVSGDLDWELWHDLALIDGDVWEAGEVAVADAIQDIHAHHLTKRAPQEENIEFDGSTGKFKLVHLPPAKPDLLGATLDQISDALEDCLENLSNGLHERSRETKVLQRAALKYANNPQRLEMDFTSVHASMMRQISVDELPASEENLALVNAVQEGALGIRATHPDIAENRAILQQRAMAEMSEEDRQVVKEALPVIEDISDEVLAEDFSDDIGYIVEAEVEAENCRKLGIAERNPALAAQDEKVRVFSRAAKMFLLIKKSPDAIHAIDKSATYKAARIVTTLAALVTLGISLSVIL